MINKKTKDLRILVAGGDGTVNWVIDTIDTLCHANTDVAWPAIAILTLRKAVTLPWAGPDFIEATLPVHVAQVTLALTGVTFRWGLGKSPLRPARAEQ